MGDCLDDLTIDTPCQADWHLMKGSAWVRHCEMCRQNVYDVSRLTRREAVALIERAEGRLCVRLLRRPDGRVVTRDCVAAIVDIRKQLGWRTALLALAIGLPLHALVVVGTWAGVTHWPEWLAPVDELPATRLVRLTGQVLTPIVAPPWNSPYGRHTVGGLRPPRHHNKPRR